MNFFDKFKKIHYWAIFKWVYLSLLNSWRRRGRQYQRGDGGLRPAGVHQHGEARDFGRGEAYFELQGGRRRAPAEQLPISDVGERVQQRRQNLHRRFGVLHRRHTGGEHRRGHQNVCRHCH